MKISNTWGKYSLNLKEHPMYNFNLKEHPMYNSNLKEHGKGHSKEKGQNSPKRAPEGTAVFKAWIICFGLIDHLLVQGVVEHLKIIVRYNTLYDKLSACGFILLPRKIYCLLPTDADDPQPQAETLSLPP